jgi:predicted NAD-dependent protein-ADP-ribosyltransferase YbiA (DUF1768 family)
MEKIDWFQDLEGNHLPWSNFFKTEVFLGGLPFACNENAFQAAKTLDFNERMRIQWYRPGEAKRAGRQFKLREDWEEIKIPIMRYLIAQKFPEFLPADIVGQRVSLSRQLADTDGILMVEGNIWHDNFWGDCCCLLIDPTKKAPWGRKLECRAIGANHLGSLLMQRRDFILDKSFPFI